MNETPEQSLCQPESERGPEPQVLFVSDSHFHLKPDHQESQRVKTFLSFLEMAESADDLVLLGDIFDFWFDYPHFRLKGYESILIALDRVRQAGTRLHFVGGNHDIWAAGYFHERYGTRPDSEPGIFTFGRRRVLLDHGDGLLKFDWAYNSFRVLVRTRLGIVLAKSLHPEILFGLSTWLSGKSRGATRDEAAAIERRARNWFAKQDTAPWDLMVMGHVHHGFLYERGPRQMAALAGWFDPLSYGRLQDGIFQLCTFGEDRSLT